jgi:hypothetical protein
MSSQIATIVDYTAAVAASIQGLANALTGNSDLGVRSIYGCGAGNVSDPLRAGQKVQPGAEKAIEPFQHWSDVPDAPTIASWTQDGLYELEWNVPMRLYTNRGSLPTARGTILPFYDAYLRAFALDNRLGGLCAECHVSSFRVESDDEWVWLAVDLHVLEEVHW